MDNDGRGILTINTGSSSLKAALFRSERELSVEAERIGQEGSTLRIVDREGQTRLDETRTLPDHRAALNLFLDWLEEQSAGNDLAAVGHRVVHGGSRFVEPQAITPELIEAVEELIPFDPNHLPQALEAIRVTGERLSSVPQIACFDTAFHRTMPRVAQVYPLPREFEEAGIVRYGFHGLSYESIVDQLGGVEGVAEKVVIAHLGNGASMVALRDGRSVDTTMGFSPTGGLVMGTRTGDLDPGVLLYLLQEREMTAAEVNDLVNRRSGMLGVSGTSGDMRDLLERERDDPRAAEAVVLFCYQARKLLGGLIAALGGIDLLVFTGGIGEHAAPVRERICEGLTFAGIGIDRERNLAHDPIISPPGSAAEVRVMHTDEDAVIARHVRRILNEQGASDVSV